MSSQQGLPNDTSVPRDVDIPRFMTDASNELARLTNFARMVGIGFGFGARMSTVVSLFRRALAGVQDSAELMAPFDDYAHELEAYAHEEAAGGMSYLNGLLAVRLVTLLETVVADAVIDSLENRPETLLRDEIKRIKGPVVELLVASPGERAEYFANILLQEVKAPLRAGVGRFEAPLDAVGLAGPVDDDAKKVIFELLSIRNIVVHRNGRSDSRLLRECPWLRIAPGSFVVVTARMFERYHGVAGYYLAEIMRRWAARSGIHEMHLPALVELRDVALQKVRSYNDSEERIASQ